MQRDVLEKSLGYTFTDAAWLEQALTHPSVDQKRSTNIAYERLEYLGDAVLELVGRGRLTEEDVFRLHRLVINEQPADIYKPVGAYKREDNGTYWPNEQGGSTYHAYLPADEVPAAMAKWLAEFNGLYRAEATECELVDAYARTHAGFTSIHPFYDGNGRLARLLSNLPVIFAGFPPIVIPVESREDYLKALWNYERGNSDLTALKDLVRTSWKTTLDLVAEARCGR